jgi:hypothetical protein
VEAFSAFCGQLPNVPGLRGCAASGNSSSTFRSVTSACGLRACGTSAVAEPDFLCYCGEPARKLTAGTERNRGRKFFVCRKSEFGKVDLVSPCSLDGVDFFRNDAMSY